MESPITIPDHLADQLKALGHPVRLQIVQQLKSMEACNCSEMCDCFLQSQSTISQHLSVLKKAGILKYAKEGNQSRFSINHDALNALIAALGRLAGEQNSGRCRGR